MTPPAASRRSPAATRLLLPALLLLLFAGLTASIGFTSNPEINDGETVYTDVPLVCAWNNSADTDAINVTWYRNASKYTSLLDTTDLNTTSTISSSATQKNETWTCNVTLFNATDNASLADSVVVANSPPTTEVPGSGIFSGGVDVGSVILLDEDATILLDVNASDADGDTLRYLLADDFCTRTSQTLGTYTCTPLHEDILNGSGSEVVTETLISFAVTDYDLIGGRDILFRITPVNDAPLVTIPDQRINVTARLNQTFNVTDEEGDHPINATLDLAGTDNEVDDDIIVTIEGNATLRIRYSPSTGDTEWGDVGNRTVMINLSDALNESLLINFTLELVGVNRAPYFTNLSPTNLSSAINRTYVIAQGDTLRINLSANDPDTTERNETLTFRDDDTRFLTLTANATATDTTDAHGNTTFTAGPTDVGNHTITLFVNDTAGLEGNITIDVEVTNLNDAPVIHELSFDANNTGGNINITHLDAYLQAPFRYAINYTDYDLDYGGDTMNWTANTSSFAIDEDGVIAFTPSGAIRNETINITVADLAGNRSTVIIVLEVHNNTVPYFNETFPVLACGDGVPCVLNLSYYAKDDDAGDSITLFSAILNETLDSFSYNTTSGLISFTPSQDELGNYSVNVTIWDVPGASAWQLLNITITNANDYPRWDSSSNFSGQTIVEDHEFYHQLIASDADFLVPGSGENLTFTTNISWISVASQYVVNETAYALLSFTPNASHVGVHRITLNVTDAGNLSNLTSFNFTVLAATTPPTIDDIRPYGNDTDADALVDAWLDVSASLTSIEEINITENTTVTFSVNASDLNTSKNDLTYVWRYNGTVLSGETDDEYERSFDFFSAGTHNLSVTVWDETLGNDTWTWELTVENLNRPPQLVNNLTANLSIQAVTTYSDYFIRTFGLTRFYDPDDDLNEDGRVELDDSETQGLTYTMYPACTKLSYTIVETNSLKLTPIEVGSCTVRFNATDGDGSSVTSNPITITIEEVPQGANQDQSSASSGGGSSTTNTFLPLNQEIEVPKPLDLIAPGAITIYENETVEVPITLRNNWTGSLKDIILSAKANYTDARIAFSSNYIEELPVNTSQTVMMTVYGYRLGDNFEVRVQANVTRPVFVDSALILFNSIESSRKGEKDADIRVTFANDLLSENQECQELNELLDLAKGYLAEGNVQAGQETLDIVINGCRYLISRTRQEEQRPGLTGALIFDIEEETLRSIAFIALGVVIVIALSGLLYYHYRTKEEYNF